MNGDDRAPIFAVADGLILLNQEVSRNSTVRKLQVLKMRGQANRTGKHTFQISNASLQVFPPRWSPMAGAPARWPRRPNAARCG